MARSFKPTFDALENREMMHAGLRGALLPLPPIAGAPAAAHVHELNPVVARHAPQGVVALAATTTTWQDVDFIKGQAEQTIASKVIKAASPWSVNPFLRVTDSTVGTVTHAGNNDAGGSAHRGALLEGQQTAQSLMEQDRTKVVETATTLLKEHIIGNTGTGGVLSNRWGLYKDSRFACTSSEIVGDEIRVAFRVYNRVERDPARVQLNFTGKNVGGQKIYTFSGAGLHDYQWKWYAPLGIPGSFEGAAKDLFRDHIGSIKCYRFWEADFANRAMRQAEQIWGAKPNSFKFEGHGTGFQAIDGGFRITISTGLEKADHLTRLQITFKYDDAQLAKGFLKVSDISEGFVSRGNWIDVGSKHHYAAARQAEWNFA